MAEWPGKSDTQKQAEAVIEGFREDLGPFVVAADSTRMPMIFTDSKEDNHHIIFANDSFLSLTGYDREEVLGQDFNFLMERGTQSEAVAQITAEFDGAPSAATELCYHRKDGAAFWVAVFITPVRDQAGAVVQHFASFTDLSEHKQDQVRSAMLIDELNHRVKNTLATVRSIVSQGLRGSGDPGVIHELIESRLFALSRSHDLLALENWRSAGLLDLVNEALKPFAGQSSSRERFTIVGDNIRLPPNTALALGIAFHELATNAVKYGALSNDAGCVLISWAIEPSPEEDRLRLCWQESDGPSVTTPSRKGFGSRVIERGLVHELVAKAHLHYHRDGLLCTIDIPAPRDVGGK